MKKGQKKDLADVLWGKEDVLDLIAVDGWDEEPVDMRASEMLSFRIDEAAMTQLRDLATELEVGHTILARELLLAGLARLRTLDED